MSDKTPPEYMEAIQRSFSCTGIDWATAKGAPPCYKMAQDIKDYEFLNDLQRKAMDRAQKHWQEKTGKHNTWPDLTNLLIFLMDEIIAMENHDR